MWKIVPFFLLMTLSVQAETVRVTSGEHADFTRLVLTMATPAGWKVGRTETGYELALDRAQARFDVSGVFDLIPKDRLNGIFADPVTGNLQLTVGCLCHAVPFSLNATTIVIDLRNGPPPVNSSFEMALDGGSLPALQSAVETTVRPRLRQRADTVLPTYNWLTNAPEFMPTAPPLPIPQSHEAGSAIRETLVAQLADGAARSVIELALPDAQAPRGNAPFLADNVPLRITGSLGLQVGVGRPTTAEMQPDGLPCVPDDQLDVNGWVAAENSFAPYSGLYSDLVGEFDKPQQAAVIAAAKRYIHLGFGVEAKAMLAAFDAPTDPDGVLTDLASVMDGSPVADPNAFSGMEACDTAAALWAFLAADIPPQNMVNMAALKRSFSALPAHLRTHLGPILIEKLLRRGAEDVAVDIRGAMDRGARDDTRAVALATSDILLATGGAEQAVGQLQDVLADPGVMQAQATVKLVIAQTAADEPVAPETVAVIEALLEEYQGHALSVDLLDAYGLALAGSGQFSQAKQFSEQGHSLDPVFWQVLADRGSDDDLLRHATTPVPENVPKKAAALIADRLLGLGFVAEAALWRPLNADPAPITLVPSDDALPTETVRAARWTGDWQTVASMDAGAWEGLATQLGNAGLQPQATTLALATETLNQSQTSRELIDQILAETVPPAPAP